MDVRDVLGDATLEGEYPQRPGHEFDHFSAIEMLNGNEDGRHAQHQLKVEHNEDGAVAEARRGAHPRIEQPAVQQQRCAGQREHPGGAAHDDGDDLFEAVADTEKIEYLDRRQQSHKMAEEDNQYADVEQHRAPDQLLAAQELARSRTP